MNIHLSPVVPAMVAQADPASLTAKLAGLAAQLAAGLTGLAVAAIGAYLIWQLLVTALSNPSVKKLGTVVLAALAAVFLVGAAPDMLDIAYQYGTTFVSGP